MNGITHSVVDYGGDVVGLPSSIKALEEEVDSVTGTARWVAGNEESLHALHAEHWNFSASTKENIALFDRAIQRSNTDLVHSFLLARAPIVATNPEESPICTASRSGNVALVTQLLTMQPAHFKLPSDVADSCLSQSALAGNLALADLWLDRGAHPNPRPAGNSETPTPPSPLLDAVTGGNPRIVERLLSAHADITSKRNKDRSLVSFALSRIENQDPGENRDDRVRIVRLLLEAGADVNEETDDDRGALYEVSEAPELIPDLIAAGANVNLRNDQGETPLMYASSEESVKALLAAGADPTVRSNDGKSVVDKVRQWSCKQCVTLIQQAITPPTQAAGQPH